MKNIVLYSLFFTLICLTTVMTEEISATKIKQQIPFGVVNQEIAHFSYGPHEKFKYDLFWSGGVKIGEMVLELKKGSECADCFEIHSNISSTGGIVHRLYPVEDKNITYVKGANRLPYFCEMWQKQGKNYRAHKRVFYDQDKYTITKYKEEEGEKERKKVYKLNGVVYNEFASFFSSRVMDLRVEQPVLVPTFGDDKRNEVVVKTLANENLKETPYGKVKTLKVSPILTFSGLYDKQGDTVIWYSDDECRVPILVNTKIVVGSITAKLVNYDNPLCSRYYLGEVE